MDRRVRSARSERIGLARMAGVWAAVIVLLLFVWQTLDSTRSMIASTVAWARYEPDGRREFYRYVAIPDDTPRPGRGPYFSPGYFDANGEPRVITADESMRFVRIEADLDAVVRGWPMPVVVTAVLDVACIDHERTTLREDRLSRREAVRGLAELDPPDWTRGAFSGWSMTAAPLGSAPEPIEQRLVRWLRPLSGVTASAARKGDPSHMILWDGVAMSLLVAIGAPLIAYVCVARTVHSLLVLLRARSMRERTTCHACGYPLAGLPTPICPECGEATLVGRSELPRVP